MRHQVLILNRGRKRAPNLRSSDRIIAGLCTLLMRPARVLRSAVVLKTSTLLHFHKMLIQQKYRVLFSPKRVRRPGPKGPTKELIDAVLEMKRRNCTWGCKRIAAQIALAFGLDIDKDVVRRTSTETYWREWANRCTYQGRWRDAVLRSLLVLKAMTYAPTGAIRRGADNVLARNPRWSPELGLSLLLA